MRRWTAAAAGAPLLFLLWLNGAPWGAQEAVIPVPPGSTAAGVVRRLTEGGQIRSVRWFRFLLRLTGADRRLKAGLYPIGRGDSAWTIVRTLSRGRGVTIRVTVPEGWTADRIAERLEAAGICGRGDFSAAVSSVSAEGFLFPDTYEFDPYISAARARDAMAARFVVAWREAVAVSSASLRGVDISTISATLDRVRFPDGRWWTVREVVTLASIVERESSRPDELALVAAVYHNRLKKKMRLEADPTVQYALGRWKERLLYRDLEVNSPYNTYRRYGLPPGPIGNPGSGALRAVMAPAEVPFLYFVADGEGGHRFSATYPQHVREVNAYRRRRLESRP